MNFNTNPSANINVNIRSCRERHKRQKMAFLFGGLLLLTAVGQAKPVAKPNILMILSDDQGFADAGFQGSKDIVTPNLDRLAAEGLRCTSGYVSHPFCSPSRAGLLTGRYQARFGHEHNPKYNPQDMREGLPLSEHILPEFLDKAGYVTGWIGKWHLGAAKPFRPENRGFDETFGFIGGGHSYLNWKVNPKNEYSVPICRNGKPVAVKEHLTVAFGREAEAFVTRHKGQPWFLYLAFNAPHTPLQPTPERLARFSNIKYLKRRKYAAQISLMDDAIGGVMNALEKTGQKKRTLVFFFSDNGAPPENAGCNAPLRGWKGECYDGGIHVPFLVSWPGKLPAGKDYQYPVISLDVFATALKCAGVPLPTNNPPDGVNLIPYLSGAKSGPPHQRLFWRTDFFLQAAVLDGNMKFVRNKLTFPNPRDHWHYTLVNKPDQIFDLSEDIGEKHDFAGKSPEVLQQLRQEWEDWNSQMAKHIAFRGDHGPERKWPNFPNNP